MARRKRPQNLLLQNNETQEDMSLESEEILVDEFPIEEEVTKLQEEKNPTELPHEVEVQQEELEVQEVGKVKMETKEEKEDLRVFFNNMVPYLQVAVVCDDDAIAKELKDTLSRGRIKYKFIGDTLGDPAISNLFRQCCVVILSHKDPVKYKRFERRAHASGRFVMIPGEEKTDLFSTLPPVIRTSNKKLVQAILNCKRDSSKPNVIRSLVKEVL